MITEIFNDENTDIIIVMLIGMWLIGFIHGFTFGRNGGKHEDYFD
jgi:hypothetical protein